MSAEVEVPRWMRDPVPVAPFADWCAETEARVGRVALLQMLGWPDGHAGSGERSVSFRFRRARRESTRRCG